MKTVLPSLTAISLYAFTVLATILASQIATREYEEQLTPWLTYTNTPFKAKNSPHPGEPVLLDVTRCNDSGRPRSYEISHFLVSKADGTRIVLPSNLVPILPGCTTDESAVNVIPKGTPPGRYYVEGYAEVDNGKSPVTVYWSSQPFEVLP